MISTLFCPLCGAANEQTHTHCFACGQPLTTEEGSAEVQAAVLLHDRYQLRKLLGSGGFSAVYLARDMREDGRAVAVKQVNLQGLSAEAVIEATDTYNREVRILSTLSHPLVPLLYDHFSDQDHWYLVLEYIAGQTLETYLNKQQAQHTPLQFAEILSMGIQLCTVLEYLHNHQPPIIYRDLKPGNIMRNQMGTLYLIDFGIARHFTPGQSRDTQPLGSPGYAAPEQYGRAQTTPQTDIYSLGVLLHQLLSGQDPSNNTQGLPPLHLIGGESMETLIASMLSPDISKRPASMQAVTRRLAHIKQQIATNDIGHSWLPLTPQASPPSGGPQIQLHLFPQAPAHPIWTPPPPVDLNPKRALAGFIAGLCGMIFGFIPLVGFLLALAGIILSSYGLSSVSHKKLATAGLVASLVAIAIVMGHCALSST